MNLHEIQYFVDEILKGNRTLLSKAITLAESKKTEHQIFAQKLLHNILPYTGKSKRIAITGVPGAGKSTFIESLGMFLIKNGYKVAVLAIDPSSSLSKGSILGDKTRMDILSKNDNAFIRPSATGGSLGGITARTFEALLLCESAGFDVILVETVGVGQSETLVHNITDFFLFLQVSGTGDDLQGIKRGIMEMADLIFLNKTDLYDSKILNDTKINLHRSLQFLPNKNSGWKRKILKGSGLGNTGIPEAWNLVEDYYQIVKKNNFLEKLRLQQKVDRINDYLEEIILNKLRDNSKFESIISENFSALENNEISAYELANKLAQKFLKNE